MLSREIALMLCVAFVFFGGALVTNSQRQDRPLDPSRDRGDLPLQKSDSLVPEAPKLQPPAGPANPATGTATGTPGPQAGATASDDPAAELQARLERLEQQQKLLEEEQKKTLKILEVFKSEVEKIRIFVSRG